MKNQLQEFQNNYQLIFLGKFVTDMMKFISKTLCTEI